MKTNTTFSHTSAYENNHFRNIGKIAKKKNWLVQSCRGYILLFHYQF